MSPDLSRIPRASRILFRVSCSQLLCAFVAIIGLADNTPRQTLRDPLRYSGGLRNSTENHRLNAKQLSQVLKSLKSKTGFEELHFDSDGFLRVGDPQKFIGGSASARALILAAVSSLELVELENSNRSPEVAFARLATVAIYESRATGKRIVVQPLQIDFSDFDYLRGSSEVVASFDLGFAILHELVHAVLNLHDVMPEGDDLGDCEQYINRVRREMGLPERQAYIATVRDAPPSPTGTNTKMAELQFARTFDREGKTKVERFYLNWEAHRVGRLSVQTTGPDAALRIQSGTTAIAQE
jgi:hypothetical protein